MTTGSIPDIRVLIREATSENLTVDVPNISVRVTQGDEYNINIVPNGITPVRTGSFSTYADLAGQVVTASYALVAETLIGSIESASYADFAVTASYVSGAASDWNSVANKPAGLVSSSAQAAEWSVATASYTANADLFDGRNSPTFASTGSNTFVGNQTITGSFNVLGTLSASLVLPPGLVSSSVQAATWTVASSSVATSASYAPTILPSGVVSSSAQASTWTVATASFALSALTASYISGTINFPDGLSVTGSVTATGGFIGTASYALTASYVSGAASTWDTITGKPSGLVSSSAQINTGSFTGSFIGALTGTASRATTASFSISSSYAPTILPSGVVSSSAQATTWTVASASVATLASTASYFSGSIEFTNGLAVTGSTISTLGFTGSLQGTSSWAQNAISASFAPTILPNGVVSSSTQASGWTVASSSIATSASFALTASYVSGAASDWNGIIGKPSGLVSSSAQATTWTVASSSIAQTASLALNNIMTASVVATTITFTKGDGSTFPITIAQSGSVESASYATVAGTTISASYAVTASYAANADLLDGLNSTIFATTGSNTFVGNQTITGSINISGSLGRVSYIDIDTTAVVAGQEGRLVWNDGDGTLDLGLKGGITTVQLGQELVARVFNAEATTLTDGTMVYISGSQGNRIAVKRASATAEFGSANTLGMVTEPILTGEEGFITLFGVVRNLNTIGLTPGALLWLSASAGQYTQTRPEAPNHGVQIGYVERVHASVGSIYVKVDNGYELDELHDVNVSGSSTGDLLTKSGSVWIHSKKLTGSYELTGSLSIGNGTLVGTSSWATNAISSSFAITASAATSITFVPATASFATSASFAPTILPSGTISSSAQAITWTVATASVATTASYSISSSFAPTILPSGVVSSSAQASTWTVATASLALTASYFDGNVNFPSGLTVTGSTLSTGGFTGSLLGTSSIAQTLVTQQISVTTPITPSYNVITSGAQHLTDGTYTITTALSGSGLNNYRLSGIFSWTSGSVDQSDTDELFLHRSGKTSTASIFMRTRMVSASTTFLEIGADMTIDTGSFTFTMVKLA